MRWTSWSSSIKNWCGNTAKNSVSRCTHGNLSQQSAANLLETVYSVMALATDGGWKSRQLTLATVLAFQPCTDHRPAQP